MGLLGFCFLEFFPQLKLEGRILSYAVGEQTFGPEEHDHAALPVHEPARVLRPIDAGQYVGIAAHPACQHEGHPLDEGLTPYSVSRRDATTSNWSSPTAAKTGSRRT